MFRNSNLRSFCVFLGRNKLYTAINIFGLSLSLMFVILIADYTFRQLTVDRFHTKADRIWTVSSSKLNTGYYLQKYLRDRYPEIETTCAVSPSGQCANETEEVRLGDRKFIATILYADSTFFDLFDFPLVAGDRSQALVSQDEVILSESFARKVFGDSDPLGQVLRFMQGNGDGTPSEFVVSGVARDFDNTVIRSRDVIMRAERITRLNSYNNESMDNAGAAVTFVLLHEGADLRPKLDDMLTYFRSFYWIYKGSVETEVRLTPLRDLYFSDLHIFSMLNHGSWSFVLVLIAVGLLVLVFAVINYINLTVAQSGFRAREMAMRRLMGSSRGSIFLKLIFESTLMCATAFFVALLLAVTAEPYVSEMLGYRLNVLGDLRGEAIAACLLLIVLLGVVSGLVPALVISRCKPLDVMNGSFRRRTKMVYSNVLITLQNVITIVLLAAVLTVTLQIRRLISVPLGYNTENILDISTDIFRDNAEVFRFRDELLRQPCVEAVGMGFGTPHDGGNNNTMPYGSDRMIGFQVLNGDSVYFRMLGFEVLRDNHNPNAMMFNEQALKELELTEDTPNFKMGNNNELNFDIGGVVRDFQVYSALDGPTPVMIRNFGEFGPDTRPWNVLVKVRGDQAEAYDAIRSVFTGVVGLDFFQGQYIEQQIAADFDAQRRLMRILGLFSCVAILISALGLLAMSTYYIQQKQQEIAVRKVFGSTRGEVLRRLLGHFMRLVLVAFVVAVPVAWYILRRWLEGYSIRIALSPWIFLSAGLAVFVIALVVVYGQTRAAANADPAKTIKTE